MHEQVALELTISCGVASYDLNAIDVGGLTDTTYFTVKIQGANGTAAFEIACRCGGTGRSGELVDQSN